LKTKGKAVQVIVIHQDQNQGSLDTLVGEFIDSFIATGQ
jgi:hypothetical protein